MKKLVLFLTAIAVGCFCVQAQTVTFTNPDIKVEFKRCICSGRTMYVDFVMTNWSGKDMTGRRTDKENMYSYADAYFTAAFDDEGNVYKPAYGITSVRIGAEVFRGMDGGSFALPSEIPVKIRVNLTDVDEFATEISLLKLTFRSMDPDTPYGVAMLEAKHIPIVRQ